MVLYSSMIFYLFALAFAIEYPTVHFLWAGSIVQDGGVSGGLVYEREMINRLKDSWPGEVEVVDVRPSHPLWPIEKERLKSLDDYILSLPESDFAIMDSIVILECADLLSSMKAKLVTLTHFPISIWPDVDPDLKKKMISQEADAYAIGKFHIIAGEFSRPILEKKYGVRSSEIINSPPGIDKNMFKPQGVRLLNTDKEFDTRTIRFLTIGNGFHHKGLDVLLKALIGVKDMDWTLTVIGRFTYDVEYTKKVFDWVDKFPHNKIKVLDVIPQEELTSYYRKHDVFVSGSRLENWGMVFAEARYIGLPLITTKTGGVKTFCREGGCRLSPINSVMQLENNIREVLENRDKLRMLIGQAQSFPPKLNTWEESVAPVVERLMDEHIKPKDEL